MSGPVFDLSQIETWKDAGPRLVNEIKPTNRSLPEIQVNSEINSLVSVWKFGDSTKLKCDAIINRTNNTFSSGEALFQSINAAAGPELAEACAKIGHCNDCETAITPGFNLPAKYVIHTVGPTGEEDEELEKTMDSVFSHIDGERIRSLGMAPFFIENNAFALVDAAKIALRKTRTFLDNPENRAKVDRIVFIDNVEQNFKTFVQLMYLFFPFDGLIRESNSSDSDDVFEEDEEEEEDFFNYSDDIDMLPTSKHGSSEPESLGSDKSSESSILI